MQEPEFYVGLSVCGGLDEMDGANGPSIAAAKSTLASATWTGGPHSGRGHGDIGGSESRGATA